MLLSAAFSELLGYTSIACWLGAQFPQVLENARRQSVEGLAFPFLMNWLLGDTTNLIGCILTHQLPFQTYLATYFCFVDFSLLVQYFYYARKEKAVPPAYLHGRERTLSGTRRYSIERGAPRYRALSNVAANVAAVAALAAQQEEHSRRHHKRSYSIEPRSPGFSGDYDDDDIDDDALARLAESFHSEGGRTARRKAVAWGYETHPGPGTASLRNSRQSSRVPHALQMSSPLDESEAIPRGRSTVRAVDVEEEDEDWLAANSQRRSSRASRKGATIVFLGVWALFGVGTFTGSSPTHSNAIREKTGKVLAHVDVPLAVVSARTLPVGAVPKPYPITSAQLAEGPTMVELPRSIESSSIKEPNTAPSTEFIIGRISAWICTVLYLTSRLPQIWKNFVRKSVEGLSIYLFIFAFLGNTFYVASILTSPNLQLPPPQASAFMRESIPYLLGSGGTLMFDVTIVCQSFLYRPKASRGRHMSRTYDEEEASLLGAEVTSADEDTSAARRRGGSREPGAPNS